MHYLNMFFVPCGSSGLAQCRVWLLGAENQKDVALSCIIIVIFQFYANLFKPITFLMQWRSAAPIYFTMKTFMAVRTALKYFSKMPGFVRAKYGIYIQYKSDLQLIQISTESHYYGPLPS